MQEQDTTPVDEDAYQQVTKKPTRKNQKGNERMKK
jgi:hypothetical protein